MPQEVETRRVIRPVRRDDKGHAVETGYVELPWECPECGGPRGIPELTRPQQLLTLPKYMRFPYHTWQNPCGCRDPEGQL